MRVERCAQQSTRRPSHHAPSPPGDYETMAKALVTIGATSQEVDIKVGHWGATAAASVVMCVHPTAAGQVLSLTALWLLAAGCLQQGPQQGVQRDARRRYCPTRCSSVRDAPPYVCRRLRLTWRSCSTACRPLTPSSSCRRAGMGSSCRSGVLCSVCAVQVVTRCAIQLGWQSALPPF